MVVGRIAYLYGYIVNICLIIETLGINHTSRLLLHVPMIKNCLSHLIKKSLA
jgi:hypothetical protein